MRCLYITIVYEHKVNEQVCGEDGNGGIASGSAVSLPLPTRVRLNLTSPISPRRTQVSSLSDSITDWDITTGNSLGTPCCEVLAGFNCLPITDLPTDSTTAIDFSNGAYTGTIPTELARLTRLTTLVLNSNTLTGSVKSRNLSNRILKSLFQRRGPIHRCSNNEVLRPRLNTTSFTEILLKFHIFHIFHAFHAISDERGRCHIETLGLCQRRSVR